MTAEQPHDYYKTLGLPRTCTVADVKKAYKRIALLTHPDKCPSDPNATEKFKTLGQAHETLSDPRKRRIYDSQNPERQHTANRYQWSHDPHPFWTEATGFSTPRDPFMGYQYTEYQNTGPQSTGSYSTTGSYCSGSYNTRNQNNESQNTESFNHGTRDPKSWTFYNSLVDDAWMRRQISLYKSGPSNNWLDAGIDAMTNWAWKKGDFSAWEDVKLTQWEREEWEVEKEQFKEKKRGEGYRVTREWQRGCLKKMWVKNPHAATTTGSVGRGSASQSAKETADRGANQSTPQTSVKDTLGYERWIKSQMNLFRSKLNHSHGEVDIEKLSMWAWGKGDFDLWADVKMVRWHKTYGYSIPEKKLPLLREQYRQDLKGQWKKNPHATNGSNAKGNEDSRSESQTAPNQGAGTRDYITSGFNAWDISRRSQSTTSQSTPSQSPPSQSSTSQSTPNQSPHHHNTSSSQHRLPPSTPTTSTKSSKLSAPRS